MTDFPTGSAGLVNAQQMLLTFLGQAGTPQTGEGGIINLQNLLQQVLAGGGVGGGMNPPGSTGIGTFTTTGTSGAATYSRATGALNVPNYSAVPPGSTGIVSPIVTSNTSGPSTYSPSTGALNIPTYAGGALNQGIVRVTAQWTNGTTVLSTGLGFPFTALYNPCVRLTFNILVSYATASTVPAITVYRTTSSIPAQGSPPNAGDVTIGVGRQLFLINTNNTLIGYFLDTTLTVGVPYNYYMAFFAANAGPATIQWTQNGQGLYINGLYAFEVK